ncbi:MAG: cell division protein ZapE [Sulfurimicrobium sp.]|nr:cell division protein ZapE [Sulfurimicrobium sp.]MDP1703282.1 cell division protein ZapE [Sulfurimicrobium sp.]MDP2199903.1 cell division protein ZapE [Sulfurimicrobium sp.]MDP3689145.1 cell division protein ZapE [Sulfurimicrobium sp.]MDZ7654609.1 cell division protein ZapE [Sulfurimicrobium sp.]
MGTSGTEVVTCLEHKAGDRGLALDPAQRAAAVYLQQVYDDLLRAPLFSGIPLLRHLIRPRPLRGVYLWGGVGRGKSFVMDAFFNCIPLGHKRRLHFHRFMQEIHSRLALLKGQPDPLARVAREIARHVRLLCLDEFHISDITDAMLMRGLLQGLCDHGVALVITSNSAPDELYRNGLQRARFLPTIALIKEHLRVMQLDGGEDYRLLALEQAGLYHVPCDAQAELALSGIFHDLAHGAGECNGTLKISGREVKARCEGAGVAWFDFHELCDTPRSKADYIELAGRYQTLLLSGVPQFDAQLLAPARRFLWLVDELYDRRVKLVLSAAVPLAQLGKNELLDGEFERVSSRLAEMQSHAYLAQPYQPA